MLINKDFHEMGPAAAEFMRASAQLLPMFLEGLPPSRAESITRMLDGGHSLGCEALCDGTGNTSVNLVCVSQDGKRTWLGCVRVPPTEPTPVQ